ncbi:hypothetical protein G2W53_044497 [Senna tora]|uniref:Putative plant transposon protein domain-containing protein n=1 Tax=Senna tora TaxID=362788 RepID=A0A834SCV3_9FABA|nr:hypothetical protein G2W53_044497 [Senna tora]
MFLAEENFNDVPILEDVSALKWNSFIEAPKQRGVSSIVREFYANYPDRKDGKVFVRNKLVPFDREAIKQIYKLPNVSQETRAFRALKEEENPDYKEIAKELGCADAKPWIISSTSHKPKSIKLSKLHVSSVCWLHFIGHHIDLAGHFTNVTKEMAFLTYRIKTKQPVDVIQLMMNQVDQATKKNIRTLYFPCLITALCAKARFPWLDSELLMDLRGPICSATICEAQRKRLGASCTELPSQAPSSSVLLQGGPSSSSVTPSSSDGLLAQLIQEQTKLIQEQSKQIEEQRKLLEDQRSATIVREFIGFFANEIKFSKSKDCLPLPPEL